MTALTDGSEKCTIGMNVCPLEVKAEENVRSQSLKSYRTKFTPVRAFRASMKDYKEQDQLVNLPLVGVQRVGLGG